MKKIYDEALVLFWSQIFILRGIYCDNSSPTAICFQVMALQSGIVEGLIDAELLSTQWYVFIYCCWPAVQITESDKE